MSGRNENICFRVTDQDVIGLRLDNICQKCYRIIREQHFKKQFKMEEY